MFSYIPNNENKTPIWIGLEIASTTASLHRWETCLVTWPQTHGYQPRVTQLDLRDTQILDNPPIIARYFAFQYLEDNQTQLVLYWYETSIFTADNATQQKHVKLSLITYPETPQDVPNIENEIFPIAQAIAGHWQPIKTWAFISMTISQNGLGLAVTATALLIGLVAPYIIETKKQEKANVNVYQKLGAKDQRLVDAIREVQKTDVPTLDKIRETYQRTTDIELTTEQAEQKLAELTKIGIARSIISNNRDDPVKTWKI
jgi:hypothetical protein